MVKVTGGIGVTGSTNCILELATSFHFLSHSFFSFARTMPLLLGRFVFKSVGLLIFCSWYVLLQFGAALFEQELFEFSLLS